MLRGGGVVGTGVAELAAALDSSPRLFALLITADTSPSAMPVARGVALDAAPADYPAALSASVII